MENRYESENHSFDKKRKKKLREHSTNAKTDSYRCQRKSGKNRHKPALEKKKNAIKLESQNIEVKNERREHKNKCRSHSYKSNHHHEPSGSRRNERISETDEHEWGGTSKRLKTSKLQDEVQKPNFELSGKLTEDVNTYNGVVIKYSEPPEARMPKKRWRLYPFKGDQPLPPLYIHRQSAYLLGRDRKVVDMPIDHPSCSKQHAALQYRLVTFERQDGSIGKQIRLYIIDLESANGTFINNKKVEPRKYIELFEKDVIKFGFSSREYVLLHEHSKDDSYSPNDN